METKMTTEDFEHHTEAAQLATVNGPVVLTEEGNPSYIFLCYEDYLKLAGTGVNDA
ncbi:hypothetical protein [Rothia sp. ZJ1223]|uniref:hypothetical protein n=1 Tax=Rothia sp. ZJ1223 TaxID=2811098 RepID=UPI001958509A|nr:hypothetical protein [Rothia sp. ZJ1223]MBM7050462.1 hypothetical protein [Rothia sp. ZJ1223]